jgi:hypothetical protein
MVSKTQTYLSENMLLKRQSYSYIKETFSQIKQILVPDEVSRVKKSGKPCRTKWKNGKQDTDS